MEEQLDLEQLMAALAMAVTNTGRLVDQAAIETEALFRGSDTLANLSRPRYVLDEVSFDVPYVVAGVTGLSSETSTPTTPITPAEPIDPRDIRQISREKLTRVPLRTEPQMRLLVGVDPTAIREAPASAQHRVKLTFRADAVEPSDITDIPDAQ